MNILYFTTAYERGIFGNRIHEEFLEQLNGRGHTTAVLVPDAKRRTRERLLVEPGATPVARTAVSATRVDRLANLVSRRTVHYDYFATALRGYRDYLVAHPEVDVVHVESVYPLGAVAAVAGGKPFVPTIRGADLIADDSIAYGFARFRSVRMLLRRTFERAALVRAVSPGAQDMAIRYGCDPAKIAVVPRHLRDDCFVADVPAFRAAKRALIAERHNVQDRKIIVAAGRLLPVKGFDTLIRAMPGVLERVPDAHVLICGPNRVDPVHGDYAAYLAGLAQAAGVAERVTLVGHVPPEQMADYLAAADAVAVPSVIEGGNKILVEGAALGTPFVATITSGTVGFFDERHCLTMQPHDHARLAAALGELLADRETWQRRSDACVAGRDRFQPDVVASAMEDVYRRAQGAA